MAAVIVGDPVIAGSLGVIDVRVAARHGVVRGPVCISERHVVRSDKAIAAVANLCASAYVDSWNRERVGWLFCRSMRDGYAEIRGRSRRSAIATKAQRFHTGDTIELDVKVGPRPIRSGPSRIGNTHMQGRGITARVTQSLRNAVLQLFIAFKHRGETCPNFA